MNAAERLNAILPPELAGAVRLGSVAEAPKQIRLPLAIEELLGGGLARGRICEVIGRRSAGRTSLVYSFLAATTEASEVAAVVDAGNAFDPPSAARASIDLASVLWVRPPSARDALHSAEMILAAGGFALVVLDLEGVSLRGLRGYTWPRLARGAEKAGAALVVLAPYRLAGSFAAVGVKMAAGRGTWGGGQGPGARGRQEEMLVGLESYATLVHNKRGPVSATRRVQWTLDDASEDQLEIQSSKLNTRSARQAR